MISSENNLVPDWDRLLAFWTIDGVIPSLSLEGTETVRNGFRYRYTRNELGSVYLKNIDPHGQIGGHLAKTYTMAEYQAQARKMAEEHAQFLTPDIRALIGMEVALAGMFDMAPAPRPADLDPHGAVYL